jgi:hypothetical protein
VGSRRQPSRRTVACRSRRRAHQPPRLADSILVPAPWPDPSG